MGLKPRRAAARTEALLAAAADSNEPGRCLEALEEIATLKPVPGAALDVAASAARTLPSAAVADIIGSKNLDAAMRWNLIWTGFSILGLLDDRKDEAVAVCVDLPNRR